MRRRHFATLAISIALFSAAISFQRQPPCHPEPSGWHSGDIVFMNGVSLRSKVVRWMQGNSSDYSHVGIVCVHDGDTFIVHADPTGGPDHSGQVVEEPWSVALGSDRVVGGAVYRLDGVSGAMAQTVQSTAETFADHHIPFDHNFEWASPNRMYCTKLVWRAYESIGVDLRPSQPGRYLLPADLLRSGRLQKVASF